MGFFPIYFKVLMSLSTKSKKGLPPLVPEFCAITSGITQYVCGNIVKTIMYIRML